MRGILIFITKNKDGLWLGFVCLVLGWVWGDVGDVCGLLVFKSNP